MNENFITEIKVNNLRCLNNLDIKLSEDKKKHLILTGRNGSGKSTLLEWIKAYCTAVQEGNFEEINSGYRITDRGLGLVKVFRFLSQIYPVNKQFIYPPKIN